MPQKILALDLGEYSIKALLINKSFRKFEIDGFFERVLPRDGEISYEETASQALKGLIQEKKLNHDTTVVSVPGIYVSTRVMTFPFKDKRRLDQIIGFEVDDLIPFSYNDMVADYHILEKKDNKTTILINMVQRSHIQKILQICHLAGIDPKIIDVDFLSLYNYSAFYLENEKGPYVVIDTGSKKSSLCIIEDKNLRLVRSIYWGGQLITDSLKEEYSLSDEEAEELKRKANSGEGGEKVLESIKRSLSNLAVEIRRTLFSYEALYKNRVLKIYLTGGTSALKNFKDFLTEELDLSVKDLPINFALPNAIAKHPGIREKIPVAMGLALRGISNNKLSRVDLRRGDFAYGKEIQALKGQLIKLGVFSIIILMLFLGNFSYKIYGLKSELLNLQSRIRREYTTSFPDERNVPKHKEVDLMRNNLNELEKQAKFIDGMSGDTLTALDILNEISARIPTGMYAIVNKLRIEKGKVAIEGTTGSFDSLDKIYQGFLESDLFKEVKKPQGQTGAKGDDVKFQVDIILKPNI